MVDAMTANHSRVKADRDVCIGAGLCAMAAARVFDQSAADGRVEVLVTHPSAEDSETVDEAIALCPSGALSWTH
jgi:ferredoxin